MSADRRRIGLSFGPAFAARDLEEGQIVVIDGAITAVDRDPDDPDRVRLRVARVLAGVEREPDEREVIVSVPSEMKIATARLFDAADMPPPPSAQ